MKLQGAEGNVSCDGQNVFPSAEERPVSATWPKVEDTLQMTCQPEGMIPAGKEKVQPDGFKKRGGQHGPWRQRLDS